MKKTEALKQDLINQFDYSILAIFRAIDQFSHGKITRDNLRTFLLNFEYASSLDDYDIECWIRRFDSDNDSGLTFTDLVSSMEIMTNYKRRDEPKPEQQKLSQG
jgi:Ca2+-binding EF-hand superfamily protein